MHTLFFDTNSIWFDASSLTMCIYPIGMDPYLSCAHNAADFEMYTVQCLLVLQCTHIEMCANYIAYLFIISYHTQINLHI